MARRMKKTTRMKRLALAMSVSLLFGGSVAAQTLDLSGANTSLTSIGGYTQVINSSETAAELSLLTGGITQSLTLGDAETAGNNNFSFEWTLTGSGDDGTRITVPSYYTDGTTLVDTGKSSLFNIASTAGVSETIDSVEYKKTQAFGTGPITLDGATIAWVGSGVKHLLANDIVLGANGGGIRQRDGGSSLIAGNISGDGEMRIVFDGSTVTFSGNNTYTGRTVVGSMVAGWANTITAKLGSATALPTDTPLFFGSEKQSVLDVNGFSISASSIATGATVDGGTFVGRISNTSTTDATVTINPTDNSSQHLSASIGVSGNTGQSNLALVWNNLAGTENYIDVSSYHTLGSTFNAAEGATGAAVKLNGVSSVGSGVVTLNGVNLDLNGSFITAPRSVSGTGRIINSSETVSTITFTSSTFPEIMNSVGISDQPQLNNVKFVWNNADERSLPTDWTNIHTGGTEFVDGIVNAYHVSTLDPNLTLNGSTLAMRNDANNSETSHVIPATSSIILGDNGGGLRLRDSVAVDVQAVISGTGDFRVSWDASTAVTLSGANTYTGKTIIGSEIGMWNSANAQAILKLGVENGIPASSAVVLGAGLSSTLDMNGFSRSFASLTGAGKLISSTATAENPSVVSVNYPEGTVSAETLTLDVGSNVVFKKTGTGTLAGSFSGTGTVEITDGGTIDVSQMSMTVANLKINNDTTIVSSRQTNWGKTFIPGNNLSYAILGTADNVLPTSYQTDMDVEANTYYKDSDSSNGVYKNYSSYAFSSFIDVASDVDVQFYKKFDDQVVMYLSPVNKDGTLGTRTTILNDGTWNNAATVVQTITAGKYFLDIRMIQGGGGTGMVTADQLLGLGISKASGTTASTNVSDYNKMTFVTEGENAGTLAGIAEIKTCVAPMNISSDLVIADGKTLTFSRTESGGGFILTGDITGAGALAVSAPTGEVAFRGTNTHTGGTTIDASKIYLGTNASQALGDGTVTITGTEAEIVLQNVTSPMQWSQTRLANDIGSSPNLNMTTDLSGGTTIMTASPTYLTKGLGGDDTNWTFAYKTSLVADANVTIDFERMYDDSVYINITDKTDGTLSQELMRSTIWNTYLSNSFDFVAGHEYDLEIRVGNGAGGQGPVVNGEITNVNGTAVGKGSFTTGSALGVVAKLSTAETYSVSNLDFNDNGCLSLSPALHIQYDDFVISNDMVLESNLTIDASGINSPNPVAITGKFTGAGALELKNGTFSILSSDNALSGLTMTNAVLEVDDIQALGAFGAISMPGSSLKLDLTDLDTVPLADDFAMMNATSVDLTDLILSLAYDGEVADLITTVTLMHSEDALDPEVPLPKLMFENPQLRGALSVDGNNVNLTFGNVNTVPEPSTWILLILGAAGLWCVRRTDTV